uniref:uncharacterized protein LOC124063507 n=1 Tax=Scatophagus argus TaxID=75038 RepID=UPI001ED842B6|nr:uncharacterized protein LOC124063507 [Scatophagus argus]
MEAGVVLLLLVAALSPASTANFYGDSISFMHPQRNNNGTFTVTFHHRHNGRSSCAFQSSLTCESGVCSVFDQSSVLQTDHDSTDQGKWCQSEQRTTAIVSTDGTSFSLRLTDLSGKTNWTSYAEVDLGIRSDSHNYNTCPVTTTMSSLRVPQNCFEKLQLLAYDPEGDHVRCSFAPGATLPSNISLDEAACKLTSTSQVKVGVHMFELMLEDFPTRNITLTYADGTSAFREASNMNASPLCKVKLQFSVEILPPIPNCEAGHVQPMFLSMTPSHGDVLYATVGKRYQLHAEAQAHHSSIYDFQVSGPQNMTKEFTDEVDGKAKLTLSWTPQHIDLYRFVPVCFTAETRETQSEMRCVVLMVTSADITQGKAAVECSANKMVVTLEKASMPGIDMNYLKLRDESCSLSSNDTHIIGIMSFRTCGTKLEDKGDFIVFKNEIKSFELPTEVIIRRRKIKISFSCQFPKTISISSYYRLHKSDYIFTESSFGSFSYAFEIYRDNKFSNKVEARAYPVEIKLLEPFYMGIQAQSELPNVKLFVESCKGTPDDNPENPIFYDIIKNGCIQDETLKIYPSDNTSFNFEVQAFKFTGNYEEVYITCSVILCDPVSPFSRCAQGCVSEAARRRRRRRGLGLETDSHNIIQGPLRFVPQDAPIAAMDDNSKSYFYNTKTQQSDLPVTVIPPPVLSDTKSGSGGWGIKEALSSSSSTVVFATLFLVSLVLMAALVRYFTSKRKAEDHKSLIGSSCED